MFDELCRLYQYVDETMRMLYEKFPDEVMCEKGCSDCCHAVFDLSLIEALYLLSVFGDRSEEVQQQVLSRCEPALERWKDFMAAGEDLSRARIRCPLLNDNGECDCYEARPVNCRTYGVPTIINGAAHVCGLSRFKKGISYPAVSLDPLQKSLYEYSVKIGGQEQGAKRHSVAATLLFPENLPSYCR